MVESFGAKGAASAPARRKRPVGVRILQGVGYPFQLLLGRDEMSPQLLALVSSVTLFGGIYLIGLALAFHYGEPRQYLGNPLVPSLLVATGWCAVWISWASSVYEAGMYEVTKGRASWAALTFLRLPEDRKAELKAHWDRLCDTRQALKYSIPAMALIAVYAFFSIYTPFGLPTLAPTSVIALYRFPDQSYIMFLYLTAVAAIFALTGSFGLFFTFEHLRFLSSFVKGETNSLASDKTTTTVRNLYLAHKPLQELASATFLSSTAWFGAVAILVGVFVVEVNVATFLGLLVLIGFGFYVFIRPQWEAHVLIRTAKETALKQLEVSLGEQWYDAQRGVPKPEHLTTLAVVHGISAMDDWHIDLRLVAAQVAGALVPILLAFAGGSLGIRLA